MSGLLSPLSLAGAYAFVLLAGLGLATETPSTPSAAPDDSTGARIHTERTGDHLRIQGLFVNADGPADTLHYELSVHRGGAAGTTRTTQSGTFDTAPGRTDTLSTTQVNVQSGDEIDLRLVVHRAETPIDSARTRRTIP